MHPAFESGPYDLFSTSLKYLRYRGLNSKSHKGEFTQSEVYYHQESIADGPRWLQIVASHGESVFEDERTPKISAIRKALSKAERLEYTESAWS